MACNSQGFWTPWWWLRLSGRNILEWLNNNKLINPKLICAFCWFVLFFNYENARSKKQNNRYSSSSYYYWGREEGCTGFWWGSLRERDDMGDPDVDGRIILRWIFRKWEGVLGTGWSWLRIGTGGGHLWVRWWTFGFRKMRGISWLAAEPVSFSRRTLLHGVSN